MGASCAPTIANIYMSQFESKFIFNEIAPFYESVTRWSRFIGDVFFVWNDGHENLKQFLEWINLCDDNIHFTYTISTQQVEYLDIIIKEESGLLTVDLFVKPTARNTLLHYESYHPTIQKNSIPFGEFLRVRRNCTNIRDFDIKAETMKKKFLMRGYPKKVIRDSYKRARFYDRQHLLTKTKTSKDPSLVFVTRHSMLNDRIRQAVCSS